MSISPRNATLLSPLSQTANGRTPESERGLRRRRRNSRIVRSVSFDAREGIGRSVSFDAREGRGKRGRKALTERTNSFDEREESPVAKKARCASPVECSCSPMAPESVGKLFLIGEAVGSGVFGDVRLLRCRQTNEQFVLKAENNSEASSGVQLRNEKNCFTQLGAHPFVVRMHRSSTTFPESPASLVLEFHPARDLYSHLRPVHRATGSGFAMDHCRFYAANLMLAVKHLHDHRIAHRDLKPENWLVNSNGYLVISDFGLASICKPAEDTSTFCSTFVGSCTYMAPEVIFKKPYGCPADAWAFAVALYELMTGKILFNSVDEPGNLTKIFTNVIRSKANGPPIEQGFVEKHPAATDLLRGMLAFEPSKRLTFEGALQHAFVNEIDMGMMERQELVAPVLSTVAGVQTIAGIPPRAPAPTKAVVKAVATPAPAAV
jgi:serine/threonine protein kinase